MENKTTPRDHLANERTFLSWIRTSIVVMAFGFVIERFSLFVKDIATFISSNHETTTPPRDIPFFGLFFIVIGALIGIVAYLNFQKTRRQLEEENYKYSPLLALSLLIFILLMCGLLITYLLVV